MVHIFSMIQLFWHSSISTNWPSVKHVKSELDQNETNGLEMESLIDI